MMLKKIVEVSYQRVKEVKKSCVEGGQTLDAVKFTAELIMECIHQCVFGANSSDLPLLKYIKEDGVEHLNPGIFIRTSFIN